MSRSDVQHVFEEAIAAAGAPSRPGRLFAEVPQPGEPLQPVIPEEPVVPTPSEPVSPVAPEEPSAPIDPTPDREVPEPAAPEVEPQPDPPVGDTRG